MYICGLINFQLNYRQQNCVGSRVVRRENFKTQVLFTTPEEYLVRSEYIIIEMVYKVQMLYNWEFVLIKSIFIQYMHY